MQTSRNTVNKSEKNKEADDNTIMFFLYINRKSGHNTIKIAVQGTTDKSWHKNANISASSTPPDSIMSFS